MIELFMDRFERQPEVGEVLHPTFARRQRPTDMNLDAKRMAVQPPALVPFRHLGQVMRCFDGELLEDVHRGGSGCGKC